MELVINILQFVIGLSVLVLIHEFGHFITAKWFGVKVEEFGIGFPPRAFGIRRGETLYSVNWLPVGGFVKLYGEDDAGGGKLPSKDTKEKQEHMDLKRAFFARPAWQRALMIVAGVIMNFVLAVLIISYLFSSQGVAVPTGVIKISGLSKSSPATMAGIKVGDQVVSFAGKKITTSTDFITEAKKDTGESVPVVIKRGDTTQTFQVTPRKGYPQPGCEKKNNCEGPLGVEISDMELKKFAWYEAPFYGTWEAGKFSVTIIQGLGQMIGDFALKGQKPQGVAGPVGVYQLSAQAANYGINSWLWFMALLSLNLAVMNVLPIPALDGGRLFFILIELVTRKKVSSKYESYAHAVGLVVLLGFLLLITLQDVLRIIAGKSIIPN